VSSTDARKATPASTGVWLATRKARPDHATPLSPSHVSAVQSHFQFILCWFFPSFFLDFIPACYDREKWAIAHLLLDKIFIVKK
jgi:hypothetical protein